MCGLLIICGSLFQLPRKIEARLGCSVFSRAQGPRISVLVSLTLLLMYRCIVSFPVAKISVRKKRKRSVEFIETAAIKFSPFLCEKCENYLWHRGERIYGNFRWFISPLLDSYMKFKTWLEESEELKSLVTFQIGARRGNRLEMLRNGGFFPALPFFSDQLS